MHLGEWVPKCEIMFNQNLPRCFLSFAFIINIDPNCSFCIKTIMHNANHHISYLWIIKVKVNVVKIHKTGNVQDQHFVF